MFSEDIGDLLFVVFDGSNYILELVADELDADGEALVEGRFIADGHGLLDELEALVDEFVAARAVEVVELFESAGFGLLERHERGPFKQESGGQWAPKVLAAKLQ